MSAQARTPIGYLSTPGGVAVFARHGGRRLAATARPRSGSLREAFPFARRLLFRTHNNNPHPQGDTP